MVATTKAPPPHHLALYSLVWSPSSAPVRHVKPVFSPHLTLDNLSKGRSVTPPTCNFATLPLALDPVALSRNAIACAYLGVLVSFPCVYRDSSLVLFYFKSSLMLIPPCFTGVVPSPPCHPTTWTPLPASHVSNLLCLFVSRYVRTIAFRFDAFGRPHVDDSAPQASGLQNPVRSL